MTPCKGGIIILKPVDAKEIPVEQKIFNEAWDMLKTYHDIKARGNDKEWSDAIDRADYIYRLGSGKPETEALSIALSMGVIRYLENISKGE